MKRKLLDGLFVLVSLLIVILFFTIIDHAIHGLDKAWGVPDYYFRNKIPFGFLWGIVGLYITRKLHNVWLKALIVSSIIAVTLQTRYFIEGYPLDFVLLFLLFHFLILYSLTAGMFLVSNRYSNNTYNKMNKTVIALLALVVVGIGAYYLVFASKGGLYTNPSQTPSTSQQTPTSAAPATKNAVEITNFSFSPAILTVKVGDTVTWTNKDSMGHSATADDKSFDTGVLDQGKSGTNTFSKVGTYTYYCSVHPSMHGTIVVQ